MDRNFYAKLVNRPYVEGVNDCYGLLRDFYKLCYNITLPDFARPEHLWVTPNNNLWANMAEHADIGLLHVPPARLREGDIIAFAVRSSHMNHLGVYVGNNLFLHHVYNKPSEVSILSVGWQGLILGKGRHKDVGALIGYGQT